VGAKCRARACLRRRFFLSAIRDQITFRQLCNGDFLFKCLYLRGRLRLTTARPWHVIRGWNADFGQKFMKSFHSGVICPQNPNLEGVTHAPHFEQATGQALHCREIPFTPYHSQGPGSFRGLDNFLCDVRLQSYGTSKLPNFSDFWHIFPIQNPYKSTFRWPAYRPGLHLRMIMIFPCGSRRSKGVPSRSGVFLRLLVGELGPPNLPKVSPMANGYTHTEC